jgi:hypothetical protein
MTLGWPLPLAATMPVAVGRTYAGDGLQDIVIAPMKQIFAASLFAACCTMLGTPAAEAARAKKETVFSVKGEIVDLVCYLSDGKKKGESHEACARDCISAGNPVGLLTSGGKLYLMLGKDMKPANDLLTPYAAKQVRVKGRKCSRGEMAAVIVESVEELPPAKTKAKPRKN